VLKGKLFEEQQKYPEAQAAYGVAEKATGVRGDRPAGAPRRCAAAWSR
jgi:hypothetical protein